VALVTLEGARRGSFSGGNPVQRRAHLILGIALQDFDPIAARVDDGAGIVHAAEAVPLPITMASTAIPVTANARVNYLCPNLDVLMPSHRYPIQIAPQQIQKVS
jgi:hypothetical protein